MLKLNLAKETRETNPFVDIWAADRDHHAVEVGAVTGRPTAPVSTGRYVATITLSCITCVLGLLLAGYGLFQITRPLLSLSLGITFAGLGGTVVVGSAVLIQMTWSGMNRRLRHYQRIAEVTSAHEPR